MYIICDVETTDLKMPMAADLELQPRIIEIAAIQVNKKFKVIKEFETLVNPTIPIPPFITRHTGISDMDVANAPKFKKVVKALTKCFKGSQVFVGHNSTFDWGVLWYELKRCKKHWKFPLMARHYCTVEQSMHLHGYRMKLDELFYEMTGKQMVGHHRAMNDVVATLAIFERMVKNGGEK